PPYITLFILPAPPPPEFYTLSLHDALPILAARAVRRLTVAAERDQAHAGGRQRAAELRGELVAIHAGQSDVEDRDVRGELADHGDRKSTRLNSSHVAISYAVFCLKKKNDKR